jgi:protein-tyrosine phosphatase
LVDLIQKNGALREDQRFQEAQELQRAQAASAENGNASAPSGRGFSADLVYREEETGFELWLGSLEDALSFPDLRDRDVNGIVNCAVEECRRECATFRCKKAEDEDSAPRGRRRTHARGASLAGDGEATASRIGLPKDVLRGLVEFDMMWYSDIFDYDMAYCGLEADDEDGYRMDQHFEEVQDFLSECRLEGRKVLVHCIMGINRSSVALVAFLCSGVGMDLTTAVALASKQRGYILSNNSFLDQLIEHFGLPEEAKAVNEEASDVAKVLGDS